MTASIPEVAEWPVLVITAAKPPFTEKSLREWHHVSLDFQLPTYKSILRIGLTTALLTLLEVGRLSSLEYIFSLSR